MTFVDPKTITETFGLEPGMHVADLGAGSGHYSFAAAHLVGDAGKVYAVDIQQELVNTIKSAARQQNLNNLEVIWGDLEEIGGTTIRDASVHVAIVSNVLFQADDKQTFAKEAYRIVKPGGRVFVIDWTDSFGGLGPRPGDLYSRDTAKQDFAGAGFHFEREFSPGAHHYGLVFVK